MELNQGVYENIINNEIDSEIKQLTNSSIKKLPIDKAEASAILTTYFSKTLKQKLDENDSLPDNIALVNKLIQTFSESKEELITDNENFLAEVISDQKKTEQQALNTETTRPESGFLYSSLFTGRGSKIPLYSEIKKDIESSDEIYFIISFLKLSGLNLIYDDLKKFCSQPNHKLKIITTTYCGITDPKAVQRIAELPNTEVRISYNIKKECLHAKSYIFIRKSGCSTAYIGSSNLSKSAQTEGLEWNIRVTNAENEHIINAAKATFDTYWNNPDFEEYKPEDEEKLRKELKIAKTGGISFEHLQQFTILPHQRKILQKIQVEREQNGNYKNLVVAATGTGKTVISAFDYRRFCNKEQPHKLLFIAHRKEILEQSLRTYRSVLNDSNFGELWVGDYKPINGLDHLFLSVDMFASRWEETFSKLKSDYYDFIVIDEAHHSTANSYRELFRYFKPKVLLGLTATPERMDGSSLLPDFGGKITAEIRLPEALEQGLLSPFQYYCISDDTDLTDDAIWRGGKYIDSELSVRLCTKQRSALIVKTLNYYLADEQKVKALCFCTDKEHAKYTAESLSSVGLKADYLVSGDSSDKKTKRKEVVNKLQRGEINYLCVVDIFNEGVDIPEVDTVLFLRPTESLTIFLQQLGRGLRLCPEKEVLTVFDFVAHVNKKFDFESRFRALLKKGDGGIDIKKQIAEGFVLLPPGCSIMMEQKAQEYVLQTISAAIFTSKKLIQSIQSYSSIPTLGEFIKDINQDVRLIYKGKKCWTSLLREAGKVTYQEDAFTQLLTNNITKLTHLNCANYLRFILKIIDEKEKLVCINQTEEKYLYIFCYNLFYKKEDKNGPETDMSSLKVLLTKLNNYPLFVKEIKELIEYKLDNLEIVTEPLSESVDYGVEAYGCYNRNEILALFGMKINKWNNLTQQQQSGIVPVSEDTELFFVTLNKSEKEFSPTNMYKDYIISDHKIHTQSQNKESISGSGSRYINQKKNGKKFILFVRETTTDGFGNTNPFYCFGYIDYITSTGEKPMNIEWYVEKPIMPKFLEAL
ncbi:DUF3427 domain-containing protein [Treponema sp.]|uniref:DUF3427 domain-containing protein n=1 Tax=Treponema sp. TaxID=166 RepID=UPI00298D79C4|nr:DUF3427 domain-containing protein [Treponema sp.]